MKNPTPLFHDRQPKALFPLCATEMWERFGFYIVQGMLVLLMANYFHFSDKEAISLAGEYGALVYISPIIGGHFADKYLGFRYTILIGAFFQFIGYLFIATLDLNLIYWGLASVILGNGFLKPNLTSYLGEFYTKNDARRQAGFTYYYTIMNTGTFIATSSAGFIQEAWGWHLCFITASVGMLVGTLIYLANMSRYEDKGLPIVTDYIRQHTLKFISLTTLLCIGIIFVCYFLLSHTGIGNQVLLAIGSITLLYLGIVARRYYGQERRHLIALVILLVFAVIFWAIFFEMFSVVNLFIDRNVDRTVLGIHIPPIAFISLEPVFIVILGWPLALLWKYLHHKQLNPSIISKFVCALLVLALSMKLLNFALAHTNAEFFVFPSWMVLFFLLLTVGEMLLSPNLLSVVTEFSPANIVGLMMGLQYMAIGIGSAISGLLGQLAAVPEHVTDIQVTNQIYGHAFNVYALICLISAIFIGMVSPFISKLLVQKK